MRTVAPSISFVIGTMRRQTAAAWGKWSTCGAAAAGRPSVSRVNCSATTLPCSWLCSCIWLDPFHDARVQRRAFDFDVVSNRWRGVFDLAGDVVRVVTDPAEQGRAARVLPGEAEEVQAGDLRDSALVAGTPI